MVSPEEESWQRLLESWSLELLSASDRVSHLIGNRHQPTKGSYREMLLRRLLRRILPDRYRVSTGFIYQWEGPPSRQIDVLIWDSHEHTALLEEGELAIVDLHSVAAVVEVKSLLNRAELLDAMSLLHPPWLVSWRFAMSETGIRQSVPKHIPARAIFAFDSDPSDPAEASRSFLRVLEEFYRRMYGTDARRALEDRLHPGQTLANLVDAVCVANALEIEQATVTLFPSEDRAPSVPGFIACTGGSGGSSRAVGRFCMYLLWRLTGWQAAEPAKRALRRPDIVPGGIRPLARLNVPIQRARVWGKDFDPEDVSYPEPPLWTIEE